MNRDQGQARFILGLLMLITVLLSACDPAEPTPELIDAQAVPTLKVYPSAARTAAPSPTATRTAAPPTATDSPTETPLPLAPVVVVVAPIPAGYPIPPEALRAVEWPAREIPHNAMSDLNAVINEVALVDLPCFEPILRNSIAYREVGTGFLDLPGACPRLPDAGGVTVVVVVQQIEAGAHIPPGSLRMAHRPYAPRDALTVLTDAIGKIARVTLYPEQVVTQARVE